LTVLAVDDDDLVLTNTVIMLDDLGHGTIQARSAEEALRILELGPLPDVVVTDHAMPHMTGAELAERIALLYPQVAVIVASGYAELAQDQQYVIKRLQKPFSQLQLQEALAAVPIG
jgi:CheY-like chemotaxis protein